jgi:iron complex outermembrane receptor protein
VNSIKYGLGQYAVSIVLPACFSLTTSLSHAAQDVVTEQSYLEDFPVVLSASRLSQPLSEAPNAMTVIDRSTIKASGFRTISDLFMLVPGMYVGNVNGHTPVVGYHGSTEEFSRRMQVLIDGRSVYLPPLSTVDWEDIPLDIDDIERIEVVRGPAAASYGANSLQGVINIITRDAASVNGASLTLAKGSEGVSDAAAHFGKADAMLDYRLTVAHRADSGYGTPILNDAKFTNQANLRANLHPLGANSFDFQLGYSDSTRGMGIYPKPDDVFRNIHVNSGFQQLTWLHAQQNGDEVKLQYYHINRNLVDDAFMSPNAGGIITAQAVSDRNDIELQQTLQLGKSNRMVWGMGTRSDYAENKELLVVPYTYRETRFFAHDEWRFSSDALINAGAMVEDVGMRQANTSPRLAINYHITPQHTLRASTSVAYRTPAIYEEHANVAGAYVSNGGLRPEKTVSKEVGYLGEFGTSGISLDARVYNDLVSDIIFADPAATPSGWPFGFANLYSANYHGYEGTLKYRWSEGSNVIVNFARQFARCEITGTATNPLYIPLYLQQDINDCPVSVPDYSGSILLTQQLGNDLQVSAGYYHLGGIKMIAGIPQSVMNRVDFRIAQSFGKVSQPGSGEVSLVVQNAFQDDYSKYSLTIETNNVQFNRRAYIGAVFNF